MKCVHENMDESQNNFTELKKPDRKGTFCMIALIQNYRKYRLIYDRKEMSG